MGILRNGWRIRRSLSPLIMHEAFAATANSRNLLSLGSRQSVIVSNVSENTARSLNSFKADNFSRGGIYLSNFGRNKTSLNSLYVSRLAKTSPSLTAFSKAFLGLEYLNIKTLINVLVSITNKLFIRFTNRSSGYSGRLYFSAKPQIGHSVRRSYLD